LARAQNVTRRTAQRIETAYRQLCRLDPAADGVPGNQITAARRWLDNQYRGGRPGSPTVQTWRSTQLFDALRPEGDDPRAVT
ncbi:hypothetical protein KBZ21_41545, partial [Streptomyces sp. A73]|nr:hypothetical protein [Streptomyces sp. A73]